MDLPKKFDTPEFRELWLDWEEFRKVELKAPLGPVSIKRQLKFLSKFTEIEAIKIVEQSINSGWRGLFEVKSFNNKWKQEEAPKQFSSVNPNTI